MPLITPTASQSIDIEDRSKISTPNDNMVGIRKRDVRKNKDRVVQVSGIDHPSKKLKVSSAKFGELAAANGMDGSAPYVGESYDAAPLISLSIQRGGSADSKSILSSCLYLS